VSDLSVILVSYNTRVLLLDCLASLYRAAESVKMEVFVIDNASRDGSAEAVAESFPQVRLIHNANNRGFAAAVNQGLRESMGRLLLLLNPDTVLGAGTLTEMTSFLDRHREAGAAGAQLIHEDGRRQNSFANLPTLATELLNKSLLRLIRPGKYLRKEGKFTGPVEVESIIGACMMVKKEVCESVGLLDEGYFFFLEETDWCLRMRKAGWKIFFLPHVRVVHLQGRSASQDLTASRIEYYRSRYRFFARHRSWLSRLILRAGLVLRLCVECLSSFLLSSLSCFLYRKEVARLKVRVGLLSWHLAGCPDNRGLKKAE
jgi:GT2 family glycosyltransferase